MLLPYPNLTLAAAWPVVTPALRGRGGRGVMQSSAHWRRIAWDELAVARTSWLLQRGVMLTADVLWACESCLDGIALGMAAAVGATLRAAGRAAAASARAVVRTVAANGADVRRHVVPPLVMLAWWGLLVACALVLAGRNGLPAGVVIVPAITLPAVAVPLCSPWLRRTAPDLYWAYKLVLVASSGAAGGARVGCGGRGGGCASAVDAVMTLAWGWASPAGAEGHLRLDNICEGVQYAAVWPACRCFGVSTLWMRLVCGKLASCRDCHRA